MALAGGVAIRVPQKAGYYYQPEGILSPDGHCRAFDARAQGTVFGNGVGIVVLRRLCDALAAHDFIRAVIKGWAINNDGSLKVGYTAPGLDGQAEVIATAHALAGIEPGSITYVEAHGTATPLGDPIEIEALTQAFRAGTDKKNFCAIGSVKTNIGHLDPAAGIASLIKTVLALENKMLPPSLYLETPNPRIDFANSPFYVSTKLSKWNTEELPRRAGVSSFGIGGTNAHVILEEAPNIETSGSSRPFQLLLLSAKSISALDTATTDLARHLRHHPELNLADVAYTYQLGRRHFVHRRMVVCKSCDEAVSALEILDPQRVFTAVKSPRQRMVGFMFSGQGSQYVNMALGLYRVEKTFRNYVDRCAEMLGPRLGFDLRSMLYPPAAGAEESADQLTRTAIAQPALFVIEYALAQLLKEWGVHPNFMIGHSIGEYVAACLAGVFSLEDALMIVAERGRLMQQLPSGSMLAVPLSEQGVQTFLEDNLHLAAINEPSLCVISGPTDAIEKVQDRLADKDLECRRLLTSHAFHSGMMDPVLGPFTEFLKRVKFNPPRVPYISNVTGTWATVSQSVSPAYWASHLRLPVRFADGVRCLLNNQNCVLVEIGPGRALSTLARRQTGRTADQVIFSSLRHPHENQPDVEVLLNTLGRLWLSGTQVDWSGFYAHEQRHRIPLPVYPFERQRYWVDPPKLATASMLQTSPARKPDIADWFYVPFWKQTVSPGAAESGKLIQRGSRWLVFEDSSGLSSHMVRHLEREGGDVITVRMGERFSRTSETAFEIDPRQPEDYHNVLRELRMLDRVPDYVAHLWCVAPQSYAQTGIRSLSSVLDLGFYSLLFLVRAFVRQNITTNVKVGVASTHLHRVLGDEELEPAIATVLGVCKAVPQEYPNIRCRSVDLALAESDGTQCEHAASQLIAELAGNSPDTVVAYRGNQRWTQIFESVRLDEAPENIPLLRQAGVYLITGGLGNIGLAIAEVLAKAVRAQLVLVGRSPFPARKDWSQWRMNHGEHDPVSRKIRRVQNLGDLGSQIMLFSADVADEDQMRMVLNKTYARFGDIHGVIHGAGTIAPDAFFGVDQADRNLCERHFRPKIHGLRVLEKLLSGKDLDFWLLLSSLSSVLAGLGFVAYSGANNFMDAVANGHRGAPGERWISVDWDAWDFRDELTVSDRSELESAMTAKQGVDALRRILFRASLPQIVVSVSDLDARVKQWINLESLGQTSQAQTKRPTPLHARPALMNPYVAPRNEVEEMISEVWQELLGIDCVGVHDNFFTQLGGHSLLATQVASRLRQLFQVELPLRRLFEAPTVAELAVELRASDKEGRDQPQERPIVSIPREDRRVTISTPGVLEVSEQVRGLISKLP